jgi:hypothetical protein
MTRFSSGNVFLFDTEHRSEDEIAADKVTIHRQLTHRIVRV